MDSFHEHQNRAVVIFAAVVAGLLILAAYFADRAGGIDEVGLYNPTYMALHYGKMTYPVHGYFDDMVVHPPVHYWIIALLMRLGLSYYYAESTPTLVMLLLCVGLIVRSPFPASVRVGFLYGIWTFAAIFDKLGVENFGMRPEAHVVAGWLAGLILLEWAHSDNWNYGKLFVGAFVLTFAAGMQYYAWPAIFAVSVYAVWVVKDRGWRSAGKPLAAMAGGGALFGVPYLLLFVIPEYPAILTLVRSTQAGGGMHNVFRAHLAAYEDWTTLRVAGGWLGTPFRFGIPMVFLSTALLLTLPATRTLALAALPLELFVLLFAWHKHAHYYLHEILMYGTAFVAVLLSGAHSVLAKCFRPAAVSIFWYLAVFALSVSLWHTGTLSARLVLSSVPRVQESEIARAAGREMLGPNAKVGSRIGAWYDSGATHWYHVAPDILWGPLQPSFNIEAYAEKFDAIAEYQHMSDLTLNQLSANLVSWYVDGSLQLGGFFFAESNSTISYLLLRSKPPSSFTGFALRHGRLYKFRENPAGNQALASLTCPLEDQTHINDPTNLMALDWRKIWPKYRNPDFFSSLLFLPSKNHADLRWGLITILMPLDELGTFIGTHRDCRVAHEYRGEIQEVDPEALVAKLRREDRPIRFYRQLFDLPGVPRNLGEPPPTDSVRLTKVINLDGMVLVNRQAALERGPALKIRTGPGMGAYAASVPIAGSVAVEFPCWIHLRARVLSGRVGLGVFNRQDRDFLTVPSLLGQSLEPVDVYISLPSLKGADDLIVRSAENDTFSQMILEQADAWVRKQDWYRHQKELASLR